MKVISSERIPIKMWLDDIEEGALEQAKNLANLPFAFKHIFLAPDCHQGFGMPIGSVLAAKNVVIPNAVGKDIGCGLVALKTSLTKISKEQIKGILGGSKEYKGGIRSLMPVGFNHHSKKQDISLMPISDHIPLNSVVHAEFESARKQIGTLGGGNHFWQLSIGSDGFIWIMVHTGSRNIGSKVADYYNKIAVDLNLKYFSSVPPSHQLAFLPLDSEKGQNYINEMQFCVDFAHSSRLLIIDNTKKCFIDIFPDITFDSVISIAHNYARMENHFGENVMIHRKGATSAKNGEIGIIPGSQGTSSYITKGKGGKESFCSCSHGAGRSMSRTKAENTLNLEKEIKKMDELGIIHGMRNKSDLQEACSSYKDISKIMSQQSDLTDILVELKPLAVIKG